MEGGKGTYLKSLGEGGEDSIKLPLGGEEERAIKQVLRKDNGHLKNP